MEQLLKDAFQRPNAPAGFSGRVLARVAARRQSARIRLAAAACVVLALGIGIGSEWQRRQEATRTVAAVRQALALAQEKVVRANAMAASRVEKSLRDLMLVRETRARTEVSEGEPKP